MKHKQFIINKNDAKQLNKLWREEMKLKLLADINVDLVICEIEWWDKTEYIKDLQNLLNNMLKKWI